MEPRSEIDQLLQTFDWQAQGTVRLLQSLPEDKYDFRPDAGGRSLGELAWHLAETDAYMPYGIEQGGFDFNTRPPGIERPLEVKSLAIGYRRVHDDAVQRIKRFTPEQLDKSYTFFDGNPMTGRDILWGAMVMHHAHHRGQLMLLCRLAGGTPPGLFGPTREEMQALRARHAAQTTTA